VPSRAKITTSAICVCINSVVSVVLVQEKVEEGKLKQIPVYFAAEVLTVNNCIKVCLDLQADKSPVVVKGPFFPRVVNPRYRIRGTMCNARIQSSKARKAI
jgi:hypothetical protein